MAIIYTTFPVFILSWSSFEHDRIMATTHFVVVTNYYRNTSVRLT